MELGCVSVGFRSSIAWEIIGKVVVVGSRPRFPVGPRNFCNLPVQPAVAVYLSIPWDNGTAPSQEVYFYSPSIPRRDLRELFISQRTLFLFTSFSVNTNVFVKWPPIFLIACYSVIPFVAPVYHFPPRATPVYMCYCFYIGTFLSLSVDSLILSFCSFHNTSY